MIDDNSEFGIDGDGDELEELQRVLYEPSAPPADSADLRYLFPEPSAPPAEENDLGIGLARHACVLLF